MIPETEMTDCEHKWIAYDDPGVYRDGLNCPVVEICDLCGARRAIQHKQQVNSLKWYEKLFLPILLALVVLCLITIAPTLTIFIWLKDWLISKKNA
jgi:hypothetical protein